MLTKYPELGDRLGSVFLLDGYLKLHRTHSKRQPFSTEGDNEKKDGGEERERKA